MRGKGEKNEDITKGAGNNADNHNVFTANSCSYRG